MLAFFFFFFFCGYQNKQGVDNAELFSPRCDISADGVLLLLLNKTMTFLFTRVGQGHGYDVAMRRDWVFHVCKLQRKHHCSV